MTKYIWLSKIVFSKCEKWSIFEWCTCRAWSTFMMVKGCISSPIQPSILARVTLWSYWIEVPFQIGGECIWKSYPTPHPSQKDWFRKKKKKRHKAADGQLILHPNRQLVNPALTLVLCVIYTGGLGFSTDQIGTALLCVAGPMLVLQLWLYPKVNFQALVTWRMDNAIH